MTSRRKKSSPKVTPTRSRKATHRGGSHRGGAPGSGGANSDFLTGGGLGGRLDRRLSGIAILENAMHRRPPKKRSLWSQLVPNSRATSGAGIRGARPHQQTQYAIRLEDRCVHLVIATPTEDGRFTLAFDQVEAPGEVLFLSGGTNDALAEALHSLAERHSIRHRTFSVSLDGDFCVTRVSMGDADSVQRNVDMLSDRVHRYLKLGPGKKTSGGMRINIDEETVYAATSVANLALVQRLDEAFEKADLSVAWIEPSLVSLARIVGHDPQWMERPVLIADGTGRRWDIGIAAGGRLLLDYRPALAETNEGFVKAVTEHLVRLKRFCLRQRKILNEPLTQLLVCGDSVKAKRAVQAFGQVDELACQSLTLPPLDHLIAFEAESDRHRITSIAAVLPRLSGTPVAEVPDLLEQIRRAPKASVTTSVLAWLGPVVAAALLTIAALGWRSIQLGKLGEMVASEATLQDQLRWTEVESERLSRNAQTLRNLERIDAEVAWRNWDQVFAHVSGCLPPTSRLRSFAVKGPERLHLEGETEEDSRLYDILGDLRRIPEVSEVGLKGTEPNDDLTGSRFTVVLVFGQRDRDRGFTKRWLEQQTPSAYPPALAQDDASVLTLEAPRVARRQVDDDPAAAETKR